MPPRAKKKAKLVTEIPPSEKNDDDTEAKALSGAAAFSVTVLENLVCPITHQLFVEPCIAEDGNMYEKAAISNWLDFKETSPLTNKNMGRTLVKSPPMTRALIESAIERKIVDAAAASTWHLECAKAEAIAPRSPDSQIISIEEHLRRAEEFSRTRPSSKEIKVMREALKLKPEWDDLSSKKRALIEKSPESISRAVAALLGSEQKLREWRELREGESKICIIDDAEELKRLCERKAPGAKVHVHWIVEMKELCGKVFVVKENLFDARAYTFDDADDDGDWIIPFDACHLVAY